MRVINFCADGIKSAAEKGFFEWAIHQDADVICIQNLDCEEHDLSSDVFFPQGYFPYFFDNMEGTNGVAIYTRKLPKAIMTGLGFNDFDIEARYIQADFDDISIGSLLIPGSSLDDGNSMERKAQFLDLLQQHLEKISNKRREFIFAGNWQIAHNINDVNHEQSDDTPGFLTEERRWLDEVIHQLGYADAFREANSDNDEFSWWPDNNPKDGWRVDYQLVSPGLRDVVEYAAIYKTKSFSNHAPVIIDYDRPFEEDEF
jgi:exodeoxyribonuclease-3